MESMWKPLKEIDLKVGADADHASVVILGGDDMFWVADGGKWYYSSREVQAAWNAIPDVEKPFALMMLLIGTDAVQGKSQSREPCTSIPKSKRLWRREWAAADKEVIAVVNGAVAEAFSKATTPALPICSVPCRVRLRCQTEHPNPPLRRTLLLTFRPSSLLHEVPEALSNSKPRSGEWSSSVHSISILSIWSILTLPAKRASLPFPSP